MTLPNDGRRHHITRPPGQRDRREPFVRVPYWLLNKRPSVPAQALKIYIAARSFTGRQRDGVLKCFPSIKAIARVFDQSTSAVDRGLNKLVELGLLKRKRRWQKSTLLTFTDLDPDSQAAEATQPAEAEKAAPGANKPAHINTESDVNDGPTLTPEVTRTQPHINTETDAHSRQNRCTELDPIPRSSISIPPNPPRGRQWVHRILESLSKKGRKKTSSKNLEAPEPQPRTTGDAAEGPGSPQGQRPVAGQPLHTARIHLVEQRTLGRRTDARNGPPRWLGA